MDSVANTVDQRFGEEIIITMTINIRNDARK